MHSTERRISDADIEAAAADMPNEGAKISNITIEKVPEIIK